MIRLVSDETLKDKAIEEAETLLVAAWTHQLRNVPHTDPRVIRLQKLIKERAERGHVR